MPETVVPIDEDRVGTITWHPLPRQDWDQIVDLHTDAAGQVNDDDLFLDLLNRALDRVDIGSESWDPLAACDIDAMLEEWPAETMDRLISDVVDATAPGSTDWARARLARNPRLLSEVLCAMSMGIAHSAFVSWSKTDQGLALAARAERADTCAGCGVPTRDMDDPTKWTPTGRECVHCEAMHRFTEIIPEAERYRIHVGLVAGTDPLLGG